MSEYRDAADKLLVAVEEVRATRVQLNRVAGILERLAPDVHDLKETIEARFIHEIRHEVVEIKKALAVLSKDVDDVERATREASGAHKTHKFEGDENGKIERVVDAAGKVKPLSWISIGLGVLLASAGVGAGVAVFRWLTGVLGTH